jgi:hypothetical protein
MNCADILIKILNTIKGSYTLIPSYVCKEWCSLLIDKQRKYLMNLYLFKLYHFVQIYEIDYYNNIYNESIFSEPNQLFQKKVMIAKTKLYLFFRRRNLKFNKYIYNALKKIIKPYIAIFLDDIENGFDREDVIEHLCAENMIIELNNLKKLC